MLGKALENYILCSIEGQPCMPRTLCSIEGSGCSVLWLCTTHYRACSYDGIEMILFKMLVYRQFHLFKLCKFLRTIYTIHCPIENTTGNPITTMMFVAKYILLLRRQLATLKTTMMFVVKYILLLRRQLAIPYNNYDVLWPSCLQLIMYTVH